MISIHPQGYGYSRFCDLLRGFQRRLSPTMRQEHVAGDKVFVDYSGKKLGIVDARTGVIREAKIFVGQVGAWDCQDFRVRAAIMDPKEVPDGTTQSSPYS